MNTLKKKSLNDNCNININDIIYNLENNTTKKNSNINNISLSNTKDLNANENRSNSLKSEIKQNNDGFQFRNKDKKWYNI